MTDLILITPDEIRTKIMCILYSDLDTKFTLNTLFNKLLENKYDKYNSSKVQGKFILKIFNHFSL